MGVCEILMELPICAISLTQHFQLICAQLSLNYFGDPLIYPQKKFLLQAFS